MKKRFDEILEESDNRFKNKIKEFKMPMHEVQLIKKMSAVFQTTLNQMKSA